ncbi:hypothetical protein BD779DRAFT_1675225 [Infundibulicybe gibba]|nr:hypothetical protein BD779DRAFT_1675225 [Infundibulicybe gibba]
MLLIPVKPPFFSDFQDLLVLNLVSQFVLECPCQALVAPSTFSTLLNTSQAITAFGLALAVWDHTITLDSEVRYAWSRSTLSPFGKAAYIFNRYITDATLALTAHHLGGTSFVTTTIFDLWERRKTIARLLIIISVLYIPTLFVIAIQTLLTDPELVVPLPHARVCGASADLESWSLQAAFGILVGADLIIILLVVLNAMSRPRRTDYDLIFALHRDGAAMYAAILAIRIITLVVTITFDPSTSLVTLAPSFAISAAVNSRLIIRVAKLKERASRDISSLWFSK